MKTFNIAIIGGGVIGTAIAREISASVKDVVLLEKMPRPGMMTSTRNSGVLHGGIYYPSGSLKSRFALPGNYVDIFVNTQKDGRDPGATRDQNISKIVLEKILVLAVAQEVGRDETKPKVVDAVTLEVSPEQAEKIDLARSIGTLSLVLRNQIDPKAIDTAGATKASLLQTPVAVVPAPEPKPVRIVRKVAAHAPANCVRVLDGADARQECF